LKISFFGSGGNVLTLMN